MTTEHSQDQELIDALVQTSFDVIAIVTRVGAEHDVSLTLMRVLGILRDRELTMAELADYLGLERSTITGLVDRAETRGLVVREANAVDGRSFRLTLSDEGQALARTVAGQVADRLRPIVSGVPADVRAALPAILGQLAPDSPEGTGASRALR